MQQTFEKFQFYKLIYHQEKHQDNSLGFFSIL